MNETPHMITKADLAQAQKILDEDPPREAVKRSPNGDKYLAVGDVKATMGRAWGHLYSARSQLVRLEVDKTEDGVDRRTGEVSYRWHAWAVAHCEVTIGPAACPLRVLSDVGTGDAQRAKSAGAAIAVAAKGASSDAFKRACYPLGKRVGLGFRLDPSVDYEDTKGPGPSAPGQSPSSAAGRPGSPPQHPSPGGREEALRGADPGNPSPPEAVKSTARWLLSNELPEAARAAIGRGEHPGQEGGARLLPDEPGWEDLGWLGLKTEAQRELLEWPAGDPLDRSLLLEVDGAAVAALGESNSGDLWSELGVELGQGAFVSGYAARLFVAAAGALAQVPF